MSLEDDVREIKDRQQILALKCAYCRAADALDHEAMLAVFTPDCDIDFSPDTDAAKAHGIEELRGFFVVAQEPVISSSHHISNVDIVFDSADRARLHCYLYSWQRFDGYPHIADCHRWARYEEGWARTDDGWRIGVLEYRVAGELNGDAFGLRFGEVVSRPVWTG
jgi:SnoaL-like domain